MKTINFFKSALLAAILLIGGNAWAETLTITKDVIPGLTTSSSNQTFTVDGIEFSGKLRYYNSNLFFTSGTDYICNTTSLGTINSITINYATGGSGSAKQYFSSGDAVINGYQSGTPQLTTSTGGTSDTYSTFAGGFFNLSISNKNLQATSIVIDYTPATSSAVATPAFSVLSGRYTETQNVEITCATEGATIYYTTNGDDPTAASTEYSGAISVSTTTTLKAIAIKVGESSSIASATYTLPIEVADIAAFNATTEGDFVKITGEITIVFSDGNSSVYAQDASGSMLIYDFDYVKTEGLTNGKTLTGLVGTTDNYNGPQMTNVIAPALGEGTPVEPAVVSEVTVGDLHKFVKLENVQFTETCDLSSRGEQGTLTSNLLVYNRLYNVSLGTAIQGKNYDIEGFVSVYSGTAQLYPISLEVNEPAFYYSESSLAFGRVENNQSKELTFTLRGEKLTADATLAVSGDNAAMFTVSPESLTKADDGTIAETTITVTYTPTEAGEHTANLDITSGELVSTISLSGEGILPVLATPVATAATTITANSFIANWEAVDNATEYELNVYQVRIPAFSVVNSSFEDGLDSWDAEDAYSLSADNAHTGTQSLYFSATQTKDLRQTINNVTPGENITVSYWYYLDNSSTGNGTRLWSSWEGSSDESLQLSGYANTKGAWTQATATAIVPEGATALKLEIRVYNGAKGYIDDVTVNLTNPLVPITGSPFTATETSLAITDLTAETNYHYSVVAKADGYTDSEASNVIDVTTSKGSGTGLCHPATLEGVSFDGQVIRNAAGLELSVYTVSGVCVKTAAGDIDMSAMPHGIYLVRSANAVLKITK